jgi:predicted phosphodiesterase
MRIARYFLLLTAFLLPFFAYCQQRKPVIAFASDTQEPMRVEKLFLKANHNLEATKLIFRDVDHLRPSALFILGDVVSLGKSNKAWKNMDRYIRQTINDSIPVYATLGNHEVMFNAKKGTRNFRARFPMYDPAGYTEIVDSVAVVLLNSNFSAMSKQEIASQNTWYQNKLVALDSDPAIRFIIVGCHHSPYTNSRVVKPSLSVQQHFVPPFIKSKKCILFLSGHSHNFERFKVGGKDFLVIGGGGGLHQPLNDNNDRMHDLSESYKPAFHYLEVTRDCNTLQITSRKLRTDFSGFDDGLSLSISE